MDNDNALKSILKNTSPGPAPEEKTAEISEPEVAKILEVKELPDAPLSTEPKKKPHHFFRGFMIFLLILLVLLGGALYYDSTQDFQWTKEVKTLLGLTENPEQPVDSPAKKSYPEEELTSEDVLIRETIDKLFLAEHGNSAIFLDEDETTLSYEKDGVSLRSFIIKETKKTTDDYEFAFIYAAEPDSVLPEDFALDGENWQSFPYYQYVFLKGSLGYTFEEKIKYLTSAEIETKKSQIEKFNKTIDGEPTEEK